MFSSSINPVTTILHNQRRYTIFSVIKKAAFLGKQLVKVSPSEMSIKREMVQVLHPWPVHPYRRLHLSSFQ